MIAEWLQNPAVEVAGWVLMHSLWQLAAVAAAIWMALWLLRAASSNTRYVVGVVGMLVMVAMPVATAIFLARSQPESAVISPSTPATVATVEAEFITGNGATALTAPLPVRPATVPWT